MNKYKIYFAFIILLLSCSKDKKITKNLDMLNYTEQVFRDTIENYSTLVISKYQNSISYNFKNYIKEDSFNFIGHDAKIICFYYKNNNKAERLIINNYKGIIPDSLNLTELKYLDIENSFVENDLFKVLKENKLIQLNISESFVYDSLMEIENFNYLKNISLHDNYTSFKVNGYMPITEILYRDVLGNRLIDISNIKLNFDELTDLDSLYIYCNNCTVNIPVRKLKRLRIKDNIIDTLYEMK